MIRKTTEYKGINDPNFIFDEIGRLTGLSGVFNTARNVTIAAIPVVGAVAVEKMVPGTMKKLASGAINIAGQVAYGTASVAGQVAYNATKFAGGKAIEGAGYVAEHAPGMLHEIGQGAASVGIEAAKFAGEKTMEGAGYVAKHAPGALYKAGQGVASAGIEVGKFVGKEALTGAKYAYNNSSPANMVPVVAIGAIMAAAYIGYQWHEERNRIIEEENKALGEAMFRSKLASEERDLVLKYKEVNRYVESVVNLSSVQLKKIEKLNESFVNEFIQTGVMNQKALDKIISDYDEVTKGLPENVKDKLMNKALELINATVACYKLKEGRAAKHR